MLETLKMDCPDSIGMGVRNESEWVSGMERNTHLEGARFIKRCIPNVFSIVSFDCPFLWVTAHSTHISHMKHFLDFTEKIVND